MNDEGQKLVFKIRKAASAVRMGGEKLFAKNGEFHGGYGWKGLQRL